MWNHSIQPMSVSAILDRTFKTYRDRFIEISLFSLLIGGIMTLLVSIFQPGAAALNPLVSFQSLISAFEYGTFDYFLDFLEPSSAMDGTQYVLMILLSLFFGFLSEIFVMPFITGGIVLITLGVFHGKEEERNSIFSYVSKRYGKLLLTQLAFIAISVLLSLPFILVFILFFVAIALSGGLVWASIAAIILISIILVFAMLFALLFFYTFTMFLFPAVIQEEIAGFKAVSRAFQLFRRKIWKSIGLFLLISLISGAVSSVLGLIAGLFGMVLPYIITTVLLSAIQGLIMPLPIIAFTFLYLDIRMTTEGYDLELRAAEALEVENEFTITEADSQND